MQFGGIDDPQAFEDAQTVVPDNGFDRSLVEGLQEIGLRAE